MEAESEEDDDDDDDDGKKVSGDIIRVALTAVSIRLRVSFPLIVVLFILYAIAAVLMYFYCNLNLLVIWLFFINLAASRCIF